MNPNKAEIENFEGIFTNNVIDRKEITSQKSNQQYELL